MVQFAVLKLVIWSYALPLLVVGFIAAFTGRVRVFLLILLPFFGQFSYFES